MSTENPQQEAQQGAGEQECPNCVSPWKCNGPHIGEAPKHGYGDDDEPQQEAPGAVACWRLVSRFGVCSVWLTGDISADAARQAIADGNRVERAYTTPPAPVDVQRLRAVIASWLVDAQRKLESSTDDYVRHVCGERITEANSLLALLDGQPAGVCVYPDCNCPFDAPADPNWCARGLPKAALGGGGGR